MATTNTVELRDALAKAGIGVVEADLAVKLWESDAAQGQKAGKTVTFYVSELLDAGRKARERSIEYAEKRRANDAAAERQARDADAFKMAILQNPQVLSSTDAFLTFAANYDVPMSVVKEFVTRIGAAKQATAQAQAKSA